MKDYPSVTQILKIWTDYSKVRPNVLEHGAYRGTEVHKSCAAIAKGLWLPPPEEELIGYIASFNNWFLRLVTEVIFVEKELIDENLCYKGHPDLLVRMKGVNGLVLPDLKTPIALQKTWKIQIASYWNLCVVNDYDVNPDYCGPLRLKQNGGIAQMDYVKNIRQKFAIFLSCLNAYRYFKGDK